MAISLNYKAKCGEKFSLSILFVSTHYTVSWLFYFYGSVRQFIIFFHSFIGTKRLTFPSKSNLLFSNDNSEFLSCFLLLYVDISNTHAHIKIMWENQTSSFFISLPLFLASPSSAAKYAICVMCVCISRACLKNAWFSRFVIECTCVRAVSMWVSWVCVCDINRIDFVVCRVSNTKTCISFSFTIRSPLWSSIRSCVYTVTNLKWN